MKTVVKEYSNGEVTVIWQNALCAHSGNCFRGLPVVFHPLRMPWVTPKESTTEKIVEQVKRCPSGALSYYMNDERPIHKS
ncbi:MAG: (4Fe-4S)-binding protein [Bacteroidota bacterium]|nr:(4Fe-4S)-binding protein [Bacteroidota bacterium]MDP4229816.1 (4Fe-4S)-binding protein [Bacteroidota bacterium]MDP4235951.1 (4Fe-4S)-binding protein [Bacteroidota bacterium]